MSGLGIARLEELSDVPGDDPSMEYLQGLEDGMLLARETIRNMSSLDNLTDDQRNQVHLMFDCLIQNVQRRKVAVLRQFSV